MIRKLAETFNPITKKLTEVEESTKKSGVLFKKLDAENETRQEIVPIEIDSKEENYKIRPLPKTPTPSAAIREANGTLMKSHNSSRLNQDNLGRANLLAVPIQTIGCNKVQLAGHVYEVTDEPFKALDSTGYTGKIMENDTDNILFDSIINETRFTLLGDRLSRRKCFIT